MKNISIIDEKVYNGSQSINYELIGEIKERKIRISIKRDSVGYQSHARIELWDGDKWNWMASIHHTQMDCMIHHAYDPNPTKSMFRKDSQKLIDIANKII